METVNKSSFVAYVMFVETTFRIRNAGSHTRCGSCLPDVRLGSSTATVVRCPTGNSIGRAVGNGACVLVDRK